MIIGLTGKARSGKDTAARALIDKDSGNRVVLAFAAPIKKIAQLYFGWDERYTDGAFKESTTELYTSDEAKYATRDYVQTLLKCGDNAEGVSMMLAGIASLVPLSPLSPRQVMQRIGTEIGQSIDKDIWIKILLTQASEANNNGKHVIVTDVRYDNEAQAIRHLGGKIVQINRPLTAGVSAHTSEAGVHPDFVDFILYNSFPTAKEFKALVQSFDLEIFSEVDYEK